MLGRLAAPPVSRGCLDLAEIEELQSAESLIDLGQADSAQRLAELRDYLRKSAQHADAVLAEQFWAGEDVVQLVHARAWFVEQLLLLAWKKLVPFVDDVSLVAVGGYGRGELHPHSDIDLLILLGDEVGAERLTAEIEAFVQLLWDAGFYLGHSVRSASECAEDAAADVVTTTTFMESRLLAGSRELLSGMLEAVSPEHIWPSKAFFEAKFEEQQQRHARYHDTAYNLESNIKEGPGGLRDIQMISWVTRRHFGARTLHGLVENGVITEREHDDLVGGQRLLWRVRYALHLLAGRGEDRLLFDFQRQIAERFGFEDSATSLAVEHFMQLYYRTVMRLERLNESLLQLLQEALSRGRAVEVREIGNEFRSAATIRAIRDHLYLVDDDFRQSEEVNRHFLALLRQPQGVYTQLQRMNRYGLLAAYLPAFGNIVGRMQYDLFHVYTVDQHTLFVVRNLRRFAYGKYKERFPHCRAVFKRIARPELLYLAAIFHDIAKGRGGDHSELGAAGAIIPNSEKSMPRISAPAWTSNPPSARWSPGWCVTTC
jgi:[protein-PII] uridylyltransferase